MKDSVLYDGGCDEGSGAACLIVLALGVAVFMVVFCMLTFRPEGGASLGAGNAPPLRSTVVSD